MKILKFTIVFLFLIVGVISASAQVQSKTYSETRKLLLEMERSHANEILKKLFEEGETRRFDLIQALYDSDQKVSLNSQSVIKYLSDPKALSALEDWFEYRKKNAPDYWESPVKLLEEIKYLSSDDKDLEKLVLKNLYSNSKDTWAKQIAFNKSSQTVLIEVVSGITFTTGWHVVIRREDGKWRLLSHYLVWQS